MVAEARDGGEVVDRRVGSHGQGDGTPHDRVGDHLAVHSPPRSGCDGRARRPGGRRSGPLPARLRDLEDLPQQHPVADEQDPRAHARRRDHRPGSARRRAVRVRGGHVERFGSRSAGRGAHAARGATGVHRRDRAEDAGAVRRDRRRVSDTVDHDAGVRALHARQRRCRHRHRLHGRRIHPRDRSRRRSRRRAGDRWHVPREQVPEHQGLGRHAARSCGDRDGRSSSRLPRRWSAAAGSPRRPR